MRVDFYSLSRAFLLLSCANALPMWEIIDLAAVTTFPELQTFYKDLRGQTQLTDEPPMEPSNMTRRAKVKKKICENIFTSHHYLMEAQRWINVDDQAVRLQLEENHPQLFRLLFVESEIPLEDVYRYENEYTLRTVHANDFDTKEFGFTCLAVDGPNNQIREYFISRAYNVNILANRGPIVGRFVFAYNDRAQLQLMSMAEESALELAFLRWTKLVGFVYAFGRIWDNLPEDPQEDPVCQLPDSYKLRLCATLYASHSLRNKVIFTPTIENVRLQCEMRDAALSKFHWGVYSSAELVFFPFVELDRYIGEWVIGCTARVIRTGRPITYYVSHGKGPNTMFVYDKAYFSRRTDRITPWNLFYNASVMASGVHNIPTTIDVAENLLERAASTALI